MRRKRTPTRGQQIRPASRSSRARLEAMVAEATVDCYNESEQVTGLFTMIEENLELPFKTSA